MTKKEKEALQSYIKHEKERGAIPDYETAFFHIIIYCGYLKGFYDEFEKELIKA